MPGRWASGGAPGGSILCGRVESGADGAIEWTKDHELLLALASGADLAGLYDWWKTNR